MLRASRPAPSVTSPAIREAPIFSTTSRFGMSRPNRWRCSQLHARCTRSSPREPPAARSIEPSVCLASSMNAMTMSTNGTTMMSATAAGADRRGGRFAEAAFEPLVPRMKKRGEDGRPRQRPQERLEQLIEQVAEEENAPIEQQRGASLPRELIRHLLRI